MNALVDQAGAELPGAVPVAGQPADPQPAEVQAGTIPQGTHVVGTDIQPGTYRTAGPDNDMGLPCYWARLSDTSGEFSAIITNGNPTGPSTITIDPGDGAFETHGCATWQAG